LRALVDDIQGMTTTNQALATSTQATRPDSLNRLADRWDAVINILAPVGYEDEDGFHYGKQPAPHFDVCVKSDLR
jgi:hypothetical protein